MLAADYIRKLISLNRADRALAFLHDIAGQLPREVNEEVVLHAANYTRLQQDKAAGNLSKAEERQLFTQLHNALLFIAGNLPSTIAAPVTGLQSAGLNIRLWLLRYRFVLVLVLWASALTGFLWLRSATKTGVPVQLDLTLSRVAFSAKSQTDMTIGQTFGALQLGQFSRVSLPAQRLRITGAAGVSRNYEASEGQIALRPGVEAEAAGFLAESVYLQSIGWQTDTRITITMPDNPEAAGGVIALDMQPGRARGIFNFQDSLLFECSQVAIDGVGDTFDADWAAGAVLTPPGEVMEALFEGRVDNLSVLLESPSGAAQPAMEKQHLPVDSVAFIRPLGNGEFASAIIGGDIRFVDSKNNTYRQIALQKGEFLQLAASRSMEIANLQWHNNIIRLQLAGIAGKLSSGPTLDTLRLQNPDLLAWLWHARPPVVALVLGVLLLVTASLLSMPMWRG